jgi:hypothetical protein
VEEEVEELMMLVEEVEPAVIELLVMDQHLYKVQL